MPIAEESLRDFDEIQAELSLLVASAHPSELHGMICGQYCAGLRMSAPAWWQACVIDLSLSGDQAQLGKPFFTQLYLIAGADLRDPECRFQPILPVDEAPLGERLEALGRWCEGFLHGFGMGGALRESELEADITTALHDMAEISRIDVEGPPDPEAEAQYCEIVEFLRLATLMIYGELGAEADTAPRAAEPAAPTGDHSIH